METDINKLIPGTLVRYNDDLCMIISFKQFVVIRQTVMHDDSKFTKKKKIYYQVLRDKCAYLALYPKEMEIISENIIINKLLYWT